MWPTKERARIYRYPTMASDPKSRIDHPNICSKLVKLALYENLKLHSSFRFIINFIVLLQLAEMKGEVESIKIKSKV